MRIGIFGGAFNPPHKEHVNIVRELIRERGYDKMLIIPSVNPPHKKSVVTSFENRLDMVKIAFGDIEEVEISDIENRDNVVHYSVDTIKVLQDMYPKDGLEFVIGGDSMIDFHTWYKPNVIAQMIPIVVVSRGDEDIELMMREIDRYNSDGANIILSNYKAKQVSSSYLRCQLYLHDKDVDLDNSLLEYIRDNKLYCDYDTILDRLKATLKPERFEHTKGVTRYAIKLNEGLRLDFNSVMLSTLLHDAAKYMSSDGYDNVPSAAIGTPVEHAFLGAEVAKRIYGISDEAIIDAIRYHCTGRASMTTLEKLVFSADMLEHGRDFEGVENLRAIIEDDFEKGFLACFNSTYEHVKSESDNMYPLTEDAYRYYNNKEK